MNPEDVAALGEARDHREVEALLSFCRECLERKGYPPAYAETTAFALVEADARGIFTHGAAGGTGLDEALARTGVAATVDVAAVPRRLEQRYPTIGVIDARGAPGHYTSRMAIEWVRELAGTHGMAKVYVFDANHFGAAGIWAEEIASDRRPPPACASWATTASGWIIRAAPPWAASTGSGPIPTRTAFRTGTASSPSTWPTPSWRRRSATSTSRKGSRRA
ncbi:MAG: hypothetical protein DMG07_10915 [Acidobacteria bacterium]|nr:MAG: hypothetical protein DMG07_10915 [Acidobacteriota bacterium]